MLFIVGLLLEQEIEFGNNKQIVHIFDRNCYIVRAILFYFT